MNHMLAPIVHILPLTLVQRERVLPVPGKVIVRKGQKVAARDVIAVANVAPEHILLNIARGLGVSIREADALIQCVVDEDLSAGDLIAGPVGLTRRVVRAPVNGKVMSVRNGSVLLQVDTEPFELQAGIIGVVSKLIPDFGAVVETTGALIQGVWGNDQAEFGLVHLKLENPEDELTADQIDISLRGTIILAGYCQDSRVLKKAADVPVKGLILSSMQSALVPVARRMNYPIVVLEGFGRVPLNKLSYDLLTTHQSREVSINAESYDPISGHRPEVIIPLPTGRELDPPEVAVPFSVGQQVRIVRNPYQTRTGKIDILYNGLVAFPSGIRTPGAQITLEDGEKVKVPLANLEVVV